MEGLVSAGVCSPDERNEDRTYGCFSGSKASVADGERGGIARCLE